MPTDVSDAQIREVEDELCAALNFAMRHSPEAPLSAIAEHLSRHLPASNSAAALQADLEHLKVTLKAELRAELKAELLAELRENKLAAAAEAPASVQPKASVAMVPITYEEAFVAIGGESELAKHMEASRQLQARVSDATLDAELKLLLPRDYTKRTGFSTKLINQPFVRDLDALYAQANSIYGSYDKCIRELAMKLGAKALVPPLKGEVRARMKAIFKYRDVSSEGVAWYRLTDLVRATLEFGDLASLYAGLQAVVDQFGEGVQELNDRYMQPLAGGYRDVQLVVRFEGHMCELQLSTEPMTRAKKTTGHRDFEVVRELTAAVAEGNLGRVVNALEFGREHLGSSGDGASALSKLLRSDAANTLPHDAAARGHAEILHAFLLHGADADAQDGDGDTPLHCAVFGGHERCVWVLLDVGRPNLDVLNSDGQTPLVKGYLMLWQRPPEQAVRAVSTLAQVAGVARVTAARSVVDEQVRKKLSNNRALVDVAADGNCEKMLAELREYADPNSRDKEGQSALEATVTNGQHDAFNLLLDFKVSLKTPDGKPSLLELASTAGKPAMVQALLEVASERMELEQLIDSLGALRAVGELEPKLIAPFAAGIATKLSSDSLGMRIAAVCVLDCLKPRRGAAREVGERARGLVRGGAVALPSGAAELMDEIRSPELRALESVECRDWDWQRCASAIIEKLKAEGVQRDQVVSIDAHSNGPNKEAIFSAHYSKALPGLGPLDDLTFDEQLHATDGWNGQYEHAARHVRDSIDRRDNLVSITAVITEGGNASCMYVFYYKDASVAAGAGLALEFVESRETGYDTAANNLIGQLKDAGAQSGQVVSIDVHNNGIDQPAIFSAFYCSSLPGLGPLDLAFDSQVDQSYGWAEYYHRSHSSIEGMMRCQLVSMTGHISRSSASVWYTFFHPSINRPTLHA
jgi:hypothetical protein